MTEIRKNVVPYPFILVSLKLVLFFLSGCSLIGGLGGSHDDPADVASKAIKSGQARGFIGVGPKGKLRGEGDNLSPLNPLPRVRTGDVRREIAHLRTKSGMRNLKVTMDRAYPMIFQLSDIMGKYGVPNDLLVVPIVESGYRPKVVSPQGMAGLWQFTSGTGGMYGLKVNLLTDDRKDPAKSTSAAARHFRDLYRDFKDWPLALAAYNAGPYRIKKACEGYSVCDFWTLARDGKVPRITMRYVPKMIAHIIVLEEARMWPFVLDR
jgi:membrane-bound lytic murein transglycosylase D